MLQNGLVLLSIVMVLGGFGLGFVSGYLTISEHLDDKDLLIDRLRERIDFLTRENEYYSHCIKSIRHHGGYNPPLKFDFSRRTKNGKT